MADAVPALISFYDVDLICRFANAFHRDWCHKDPAHYVGQHMRNCIGARMFAEHRPHLERLPAGEPFVFDATVPHRDGGVCGAQISYLPQYGPEGYCGLIIVVTFNEPAEQDLAGLLDLTHDTIVLRDMNNKVTYWNAGSEALYGWNRSEARGQDFDALTCTQFDEPYEGIKAQLLATGSWEGRLRRADRDGNEIIVAARWVLRRNGAGEPIEILESGRDTTARHRVFTELKRSEYRYRNMFQAMAVSFWECDFTPVGNALRDLASNGVRDFKQHFSDHPELIRDLIRMTQVIDVNEKTVQLFGATNKEQLLGSIDPFWPVSSEPVFAESVLSAVGRKPYFQADTKLKTLQGHEIDVHFAVGYSAESVTTGSILVGVVDGTDRVRAQNELLRTRDELAHAGRLSMLGEISASIAHEINQPLAAIVTNGEASLRWLNRDTPDLDEVRAAVTRMVKDGDRASEIISRTRAISRKSETERVDVQINDIVEDALGLLRHELQGKQIRVDTALDPNLPQCRVDSVQIYQVLVNLVLNAVQAINDGKSEMREIKIRTSVLEKGSVQIDIIDTGPGMNLSDDDDPFRAFFTTKASGMGLGLSICRTIIEDHDGRIWLARNADAGMTFSFHLPSN